MVKQEQRIPYSRLSKDSGESFTWKVLGTPKKVTEQAICNQISSSRTAPFCPNPNPHTGKCGKFTYILPDKKTEGTGICNGDGTLDNFGILTNTDGHPSWLCDPNEDKQSNLYAINLFDDGILRCVGGSSPPPASDCGKGGFPKVPGQNVCNCRIGWKSTGQTNSKCDAKIMCDKNYYGKGASEDGINKFPCWDPTDKNKLYMSADVSLTESNPDATDQKPIFKEAYVSPYNWQSNTFTDGGAGSDPVSTSHMEDLVSCNSWCNNNKKNLTLNNKTACVFRPDDTVAAENATFPFQLPGKCGIIVGSQSVTTERGPATACDNEHGGGGGGWWCGHFYNKFINPSDYSTCNNLQPDTTGSQNESCRPCVYWKAGEHWGHPSLLSTMDESGEFRGYPRAGVPGLSAKNFWNPHGPLGNWLNVNSCQGGLCRYPGDSTENGTGCGIQISGNPVKHPSSTREYPPYLAPVPRG